MLTERSHSSTGKINKLTYAETFLVGDKLRLHCKLVDKYAVYDKDWDDAKIAQELGDKITAHNVAGVRRQLIGNLRLGRGTKVNEDQLERRIEALELWASDRTKAPFVL